MSCVRSFPFVWLAAALVTAAPFSRADASGTQQGRLERVRPQAAQTENPAEDTANPPQESLAVRASPPPPEPLAEESAKTLSRSLARLAGIPSPTGEEWPLRQAILDELAGRRPGAAVEVDGLGNVRIELQRRDQWLFVLPLDDPAWAVSGNTDGGWLRVVPLARPAHPAELHQHAAGANVWVIGPEKVVPGVVALPSIHLQGGREDFPPPADASRLYIDVGGEPASTLHRVVLRSETVRLAGDQLAGWGAGRRAAMVALLDAAALGPLPSVVLTAQSRFGWRGLQAVRTDLENRRRGIIVLLPADTGGRLRVRPLRRGRRPADPASRGLVEELMMRFSGAFPGIETGRETDLPGFPAEIGAAVVLEVPVKRPDTMAETVHLRTLQELARLLHAAASGELPQNPSPAQRASDETARRWASPVRLHTAEPTDPTYHLAALVEAVGVSGKEAPVAAAVRRLLPRRYAPDLQEDAEGNLTLDIGEGAPHLLFVAHLDETGYLVAGIDPDGRLQVQKRGGFYDSIVVNRPVRVSAASGETVGGILVDDIGAGDPTAALSRAPAAPGAPAAPRVPETPVPLVERIPAERLRVDIGAAGAEEVAALGIEVGDPLTVPKSFRRLGPHLGTGRGIDDRAGCAALVAVLHHLAGGEPPPGRVTFAWVVREEVGLEGAAFLAGRLAPDLALAVDTFVSSDSPLETDAFGDAPLGGGAVLRALDSSNMSPLDLVQRVMDRAREAGIPLQVGAGRGGNDGSVFARSGSPDLPLSWPGRYSHSAVEVIDSRDHQALVRLILELLRNPPLAP